MSYRKKHIKNKIHKIKPKKSIFKRLWFWILFLFLIITVSGLYLVFFYSGIQLKNVLISGNEKIKTEELKELVFENANTGLINFWVIKITSKSIFWVNLDKININILEKFPAIEKIEIKKNFPQTISLEVKERKPVGIFCSAEQGDERCFLIDENGVVFERVLGTQDGATIVRQSIVDGEVFTGEKVIADNIIMGISKIKKNLKDNFGIDLEEAFITSPVRLNITTNENWKAYFDLNTEADIGLQLTKLNLLLNEEALSESRKDLRYIDLRPKDRAIICDNETCGG